MSDSFSHRERPRTQPELAEIAKWVLAISGIGILGTAFTVIWAARGNATELTQASQLVFNALLPLLGTWVGTVLAYYFSRKNFESASQSVERMVNLTVDQKLDQIRVEEEMIPLGQITLLKILEGKTEQDVALRDLRAKFGERITRIPIVNALGVALYIVHQSSLNRFIADKAVEGQVGVEKLTLHDLVKDAEINKWVTAIAFVSESATVAEAKAKMEAQAGCQDLIVTRTGGKNEPMLGWLTNVDIGRLSKA